MNKRLLLSFGLILLAFLLVSCGVGSGSREGSAQQGSITVEVQKTGEQTYRVAFEGDPQRRECEAYAVGRAEDTGRVGPTWTREDGEYCTTFEETFCANHPDNQYQLWVYCGGIKYRACAANRACGEIMTDKDQHLEKCIGSPGSTWPGS